MATSQKGVKVNGTAWWPFKAHGVGKGTHRYCPTYGRKSGKQGPGDSGALRRARGHNGRPSFNSGETEAKTGAVNLEPSEGTQAAG